MYHDVYQTIKMDEDLGKTPIIEVTLVLLVSLLLILIGNMVMHTGSMCIDTLVWQRSFLTTDELFPLKSVQFGEKIISVPQRTIPYLNRYFQGTSWAEQGELGNVHSNDTLNNQRHVGSDPASLTKCMQPTGPLFRFEWERHNFPIPITNESNLTGLNVTDMRLISNETIKPKTQRTKEHAKEGPHDRLH